MCSLTVKMTQIVQNPSIKPKYEYKIIANSDLFATFALKQTNK